MVEADLVKPVNEEGLVSAVPIIGQQSSTGEVLKDPSSASVCLDGGSVVVDETGGDLLSIKGLLILSNKTFTNVGLERLDVDTVQESLLTDEKFSSIRGIRTVVRIEDVGQTVNAGKCRELTVELVPLLIVAKWWIRASIRFDVLRKCRGWGVTQCGFAQRLRESTVMEN